jgi:glycosyltransferase involved in cell wall biosynthesis
MSDLKILFIYQFLSKGGVEAVIFNRMAELERRGVDTRALFFQDYGGTVDRFRDRVLISKDYKKIEQFVSAFQPGWGLHFDTPQLITVLPEWLPGIRQAYEVHTTYAKNYHLIQDSKVLERIHGLIVPSQFQAGKVKSLVRQSNKSEGKPLVVVPNGISENFFEAQPDPRFLLHPILGWVGRLEAHKNWMMYLKLVEILSLSHLQAHFWMIGGSHATEQQQNILWHKIVKANLTKRFRWFPEVPPEKMPGMLHTISSSGGCLVSTSKDESFGLAVLEGMACGCPVVVPGVGGMSEIVFSGENGFVFSPGNVKQAAQAIEEVLNNPLLHSQMESRSIELARRYSNAAVVDKLLETLQNWSQ